MQMLYLIRDFIQVRKEHFQLNNEKISIRK